MFYILQEIGANDKSNCITHIYDIGFHLMSEVSVAHLMVDVPISHLYLTWTPRFE